MSVCLPVYLSIYLPTSTYIYIYIYIHTYLYLCVSPSFSWGRSPLCRPCGFPGSRLGSCCHPSSEAWDPGFRGFFGVSIFFGSWFLGLGFLELLGFCAFLVFGFGFLGLLFFLILGFLGIWLWALGFWDLRVSGLQGSIVQGSEVFSTVTA